MSNDEKKTPTETQRKKLVISEKARRLMTLEDGELALAGGHEIPNLPTPGHPVGE
jgi:hypothetical protein